MSVLEEDQREGSRSLPYQSWPSMQAIYVREQHLHSDPFVGHTWVLFPLIPEERQGLMPTDNGFWIHSGNGPTIGKGKEIWKSAAVLKALEDARMSESLRGTGTGGGD